MVCTHHSTPCSLVDGVAVRGCLSRYRLHRPHSQDRTALPVWVTYAATTCSDQLGLLCCSFAHCKGRRGWLNSYRQQVEGQRSCGSRRRASDAGVSAAAVWGWLVACTFSTV